MSESEKPDILKKRDLYLSLANEYNRLLENHRQIDERLSEIGPQLSRLRDEFVDWFTGVPSEIRHDPNWRGA